MAENPYLLSVTMFVQPKDASTLVIMRHPEKGVAGPEVLMLLRSPESPFVPSSYVFPGGGMDDADCAQDIFNSWAEPDPGQIKTVAEKIGSEDMARALWVTCVRETFEETGILYAYRCGGGFFSTEKDGDMLSYYRERINRGELPFVKMVRDEKMALAADRIGFLSHWVTPFFSPIRYSAYFFSAMAPDGQVAVHDGREIVDHLWISPSEALRRNRRGSFRMVFPTIATLEEVDTSGGAR